MQSCNAMLMLMEEHEDKVARKFAKHLPCQMLGTSHIALLEWMCHIMRSDPTNRPQACCTRSYAV